MTKGYSGLLCAALFLLISACGSVNSGESTLPKESAISVLPSTTPLPSITAEPLSSPSPDGTDVPVCRESAGIVDSYQIPWEGESLTGRIYTPPCYQSNLDQNYPVVYLLHGATKTDQQWDSLGVDEVADQLIARGQIPPLLIVMPQENTWISLPENPFGDQLVQGVLPWVDRHYRTIPDRQHRAVGGLSRGGNWAVRLGLLHWGLFGSLGGHSTPLFFGDLNRVPGWLEEIPADNLPRIYLDIGEDDNQLDEARAFRDLLVNEDLQPEWHLSPGLHNQEYWESHLQDYLLWYSSGWSDR
jgi:enterochelin esterase-like enzyme